MNLKDKLLMQVDICIEYTRESILDCLDNTKGPIDIEDIHAAGEDIKALRRYVKFRNDVQNNSTNVDKQIRDEIIEMILDMEA